LRLFLSLPANIRLKQDKLTFFHPDCTVGSGVSPDHAPGYLYPERSRALPPVGILADFLSAHHPAPKVIILLSSTIIVKYITKRRAAVVDLL